MYLSFGLDCEKNKNKRNRGRDWPIFKKVAKGQGKKFYNIGPEERQREGVYGGGLVAKLHIENVCPSEFKLSCEM